MSALDFSGGIVPQPATNRFYNFTFPALPNGDWCIGFWTTLNNISTGAYEVAFSPAGIVSTTVPGVTLYMDGAGGAGASALTAASYGTGSTFGTYLSYSPTFSGQNEFIVIQRRGANMEYYVVDKGVTVSAPTASGPFQGTTIPQVASSFIGDATPNGAASPNQGWINPLGEFFILNNLSLTAAQVTQLAVGYSITTVASPYVYLPFRNGAVATETNLGTGGSTYNATISGSGFTTGPDFFAAASSGANPLRVTFGLF